jgi:methyltransferase
MSALDTRLAYSVLVALVALQRLVELRVSKRNVRRALARGAVEAGAGDYPWMVGLHASFLGGCLLEVWTLDRPWIPALGVPMLLVLLGATALRSWVIASLDGRWTTRVVYVPGDRLVTSGPFRWFRHPNYLVVATEMIVLPLAHGAWITAVLASAANTVLLRRRIIVEEALLERWARRAEGDPS